MVALGKSPEVERQVVPISFTVPPAAKIADPVAAIMEALDEIERALVMRGFIIAGDYEYSFAQATGKRIQCSFLVPVGETGYGTVWSVRSQALKDLAVLLPEILEQAI